MGLAIAFILKKKLGAFIQQTAVDCNQINYYYEFRIC